MFKPLALYYADGYKVGHKRMLAKGTQVLAGSWIPRSIKYAPKGVTKILSFGQQLTWRWLHDEFKENFFEVPKEVAQKFAKDMALYLGLPYDGNHFDELHDLGYLPIRTKSLPEGIETKPNIPHQTFINTVDGYAWLTLYLETIVSSLSWKPSTSATISLQYLRNLVEWVTKTDPSNSWLIPFLAHDFSARGLSPWDMLSSGLGHAVSFRGSDSLIVIPGARYFYDEPEDEVCINSVNASEHSVSTTKIFTVGEQQMIEDWLIEFPTGILSIVSDTFDLWILITVFILNLKEKILSRQGKLVIRPDSGDPVDIICGEGYQVDYSWGGWKPGDYVSFASDLNITVLEYLDPLPKTKGVIELLWDIFGGTINEQGYKVLDPHIGAIYGDSINLERQIEIYKRLEAKGFAATNIVLGVGSFTYQYNTRDSLGFAAKGVWFEVEQESDSEGETVRIGYDIFKDPVTDDGTKKSLKGRLAVLQDENGDYYCKPQCTEEEELTGCLQTIYEDGIFYNKTTLAEVRTKVLELATAPKQLDVVN